MNRWLYPCIVLLAIAVCSSNPNKNNRARRSSPILISENIRTKYEEIYILLNDSIIGGHLPYQFPVFGFLSRYDNHELEIEEDSLSIRLGGITKPQVNKSSKASLFRNKIVLNSVFLERGCREYIIQVVIHESVHAFIKWCKFSFDNNRNGVNLKFVQDHFPVNWELFIREPKFNDTIEHRLMCQNYLNAMKRCIKAYTNNDIRDTISLALAWGGLESTPEWKLRSDTCLIRCVDVAATNFNAPIGGQVFDSPPCDKDGNIRAFLDQKKNIFQITKSAIRKKSIAQSN